MKKWLFYLNFENIWLFFCALAISGSAIYSIYVLNLWGTILTIIIALSLSYIFKTKSDKLLSFNTKSLLDIKVFKRKKKFYFFCLYASLSLIGIGTTLIVLFKARSDAALISPWSELAPAFFIIIFLVNLFILLSFSTRGKLVYKQIIFSLYLFLIFSIAAIVYKLGYGFDPHIHLASLQEIMRTGFILPKTPYYLGEYSLIITGSRVLGLSLNFLNTYLLAISAAIFIPFFLNYLQANRQDKKSAWTANLLLILLGFSPFIVNTPQNYSYLFLLTTIIFIYKNAKSSLIIFSALATFTIHPLAGIPAILITAFKILQSREEKNKLVKFVSNPIVSGAIFLSSLFLAIWSIAAFSPISLARLNLGLNWPQFPEQASYALNLSYSFISNQVWLILGLSLVIFVLRKKIWQTKTKSEKTNAKILAFSVILTLLAYLISSLIKFPALIAYEQDGYTKRLLSLALIMVVPLFWEFFYYLAKEARKLNIYQKIIFATAIPLLLLVSIYASYPRFDDIYNSRGYSSSKTDLEAVRLAEAMAQGEPYIGLANQQVSAMALKSFGFHDRYLTRDNEEFYFYPIPTGGQLYQYFLDLSYIKADRATVIQAMDYAGVDQAYLIVNRYWWASAKIIAEAKMSADSWYKLGEADNYLFEYRR